MKPEVTTRYGLGLLTKVAVAILSVSTFTVPSAMAAAPGVQLAQVAPLQQQLLSPAQQQLQQQQLRLQQPLQLQNQQLQEQQMQQQQQLRLQQQPAQPLFQPQVKLRP
jgi:hypothetical protein